MLQENGPVGLEEHKPEKEALEKQMSARNVPGFAKRMRGAAGVIGLALKVLWGTVLIGEAVIQLIFQGFVTTSIEGGLLVMIGIVVLAGSILPWRRDARASILLVVTSAGSAVHTGIFAAAHPNHRLINAGVAMSCC